MRYADSQYGLDTSKKILKVNHAGEHGAINIYRAQILVCKLLQPSLLPMLEDFIKDECRHRDIFWAEIQRSKGVKCKSYILCGLGGYVMGFASALLGARGVMACTYAVEAVVINHLHGQLNYLSTKTDLTTHDVVKSILDDETNHRDTGFNNGGADNILYIPFRFLISNFTEAVIRFGMR